MVALQHQHRPSRPQSARSLTTLPTVTPDSNRFGRTDSGAVTREQDSWVLASCTLESRLLTPCPTGTLRPSHRPHGKGRAVRGSVHASPVLHEKYPGHVAQAPAWVIRPLYSPQVALRLPHMCKTPPHSPCPPRWIGSGLGTTGHRDPTPRGPQALPRSTAETYSAQQEAGACSSRGGAHFWVTILQEKKGVPYALLLHPHQPHNAQSWPPARHPAHPLD